MKTLIKSFKLAIVIIGALFGAGFLSGKEVVCFFYGGNAVIISIAVFVIFFFVIYFFLKYPKVIEGKIFTIFKAVILSGNFIISAGMLSAIDCIYDFHFPVFKDLSVFSVIALLLANIVSINGKRGLQKANCFLVPLIIVIFIATVLSCGNITFSFCGKIFAKNILGYCGLNLTLLLPLLSNLGEGENKKVILIASFISSLFIALSVFGIFLLISTLNSSILNNDLPILKMLEDNKFLYFIYRVVLIFGILTSLFCSYYQLFNFFSEDFLGIVGKIVLCVTLFIFSRLSFSAVVSTVYPIFGFCGFILIVILIFSRYVFQVWQPKNTLTSLKDKVLPYQS